MNIHEEAEYRTTATWEIVDRLGCDLRTSGLAGVCVGGAFAVASVILVLMDYGFMGGLTALASISSLCYGIGKQSVWRKALTVILAWAHEPYEEASVRCHKSVKMNQPLNGRDN